MVVARPYLPTITSKVDELNSPIKMHSLDLHELFAHCFMSMALPTARLMEEL